MLPLMELMLNAQNNGLAEQMQKQFQLNKEQSEQALEALMPAFSRGLKQNAADPTGFTRFMEALSTGKHEHYIDQPEQAFSASGMAEGNGILGHLFGNKDVSRAVAAQAAQATGLSQNLFKQLLPALAPMILGGLFKQMTGKGIPGMNQSASPQAMGQDNPLGQVLGQIMGGFQNAGGQGSAPQQGANNPFGDLLGQIMGGMQGQSQSTRGGGPAGGFDNPMGEIFADMLKGKMPGTAPNAGAGPQRYTPPDDGHVGDGGLGELFGEMFEAGRQTQDEYKKSVDTIFDDFLKGMIRDRQ